MCHVRRKPKIQHSSFKNNSLQEYGAQGRNRTTDTRIFNPLLYRLSYLGTLGGPVL